MNRRQAITAIAVATPGLLLAEGKPIRWGDSLALKYEAPRYAAIFRPDGCVEITLDGWTGWRVTFAGESIDITPAEIMAALRGRKP